MDNFISINRDANIRILFDFRPRLSWLGYPSGLADAAFYGAKCNELVRCTGLTRLMLHSLLLLDLTEKKPVEKNGREKNEVT